MGCFLIFSLKWMKPRCRLSILPVRCCAVDGVFEEVPGQGDADADVQSSPPGIVFHPASAIDATAVAQVQPDRRRRIPSAPLVAT